MTPQLYKERSANDLPKKEGQYFVIMVNPSTNEVFPSTEQFKDGKWTFNNAIVRWLEPVESPSGANHLVEALENIAKGKTDAEYAEQGFEDLRKIARKALAQYNAVEPEDPQPNKKALDKMWERASIWNEEIAPHYFKGMIKGWRMAKVGIDKIEENEKELERLATDYWATTPRTPISQPGELDTVGEHPSDSEPEGIDLWEDLYQTIGGFKTIDKSNIMDKLKSKYHITRK